MPIFVGLDDDGSPKKSPKARKTLFSADLIKSAKDHSWERLWLIFIKAFLGSSEIKKEAEMETVVFAKALSKIDEIFVKKPLLSELVNTNELMKKLINFLQRNFLCEKDKETFVLILQALGFAHINQLNLFVYFFII